MNLLIVDEDTTFSAVYAAALEKAGYTVTLATEARQALLLLSQNSVDVILTEILLPGRNGLKLIQDIRLREDWIDIPVYVLTTLQAADIGLADSLREVLGVHGYFTKQHTSPQALVSHLEQSSTAH